MAQRSRGNPWGQGSQGGGRQGKSTKKNSPVSPPPPVKSAEVRFRQAQAKLQESVQKHLDQDLELSSEEEDLETENIYDSVIQNYSQIGGKNEDLGKTQNFLENIFRSDVAICLICIATIKRAEKIWSCGSCYGFFHLLCIQRWGKDSIAHQKMAEEERANAAKKEYFWPCPKCRKNYTPESVPQRYECFCRQVIDPPFQPWLVPHSCGQVCGKDLVPSCGHSCLLLCHPGPCPPCPKTVKAKCYCSSCEKTVRCCHKEWSCEQKCNRELACKKHLCETVCHPGDCPACPKTSVMSCDCGNQSRMTPCAELSWKCDKVCGKKLDCGKHNCELVCHKGGCGPCPRTLPRACPCGAEEHVLPCTQEVATCGSTCGKLLDCGLHTCNQRCHRGACGACMEFLTKHCRCGLHQKEIACIKEYLCDTKCKGIRDCGVHPCNRKCCDGRCPPCEKICGKTLRCGQHKCTSVCHRGPCYPCGQTKQISCRCGSTVITVPCGTHKRKKNLKCNKLCLIPPDCHHEKREEHKCHLGPCPPCRQICQKPRDCGHPCNLTCHSSVVVSAVPNYKPATPWDREAESTEVKELPCLSCKAPVCVWRPRSREKMSAQKATLRGAAVERIPKLASSAIIPVVSGDSPAGGNGAGGEAEPLNPNSILTSVAKRVNDAPDDRSRWWYIVDREMAHSLTSSLHSGSSDEDDGMPAGWEPNPSPGLPASGGNQGTPESPNPDADCDVEEACDLLSKLTIKTMSGAQKRKALRLKIEAEGGIYKRKARRKSKTSANQLGPPKPSEDGGNGGKCEETAQMPDYLREGSEGREPESTMKEWSDLQGKIGEFVRMSGSQRKRYLHFIREGFTHGYAVRACEKPVSGESPQQRSVRVEPVRMPGSRKKRYAHFIRKGFTHEDALRASEKPVSGQPQQVPSKRLPVYSLSFNRAATSQHAGDTSCASWGRVSPPLGSGDCLEGGEPTAGPSKQQPEYAEEHQNYSSEGNKGCHTNMPGSQRKRYWYFICKGLTPEDALRASEEPVSGYPQQEKIREFPTSYKCDADSQPAAKASCVSWGRLSHSELFHCPADGGPAAGPSEQQPEYAEEPQNDYSEGNTESYRNMPRSQGKRYRHFIFQGLTPEDALRECEKPTSRNPQQDWMPVSSTGYSCEADSQPTVETSSVSWGRMSPPSGLFDCPTGGSSAGPSEQQSEYDRPPEFTEEQQNHSSEGNKEDCDKMKKSQRKRYRYFIRNGLSHEDAIRAMSRDPRQERKRSYAASQPAAEASSVFLETRPAPVGSGPVIEEPTAGPSKQQPEFTEERQNDPAERNTRWPHKKDYWKMPKPQRERYRYYIRKGFTHEDAVKASEKDGDPGQERKPAASQPAVEGVQRVPYNPHRGLKIGIAHADFPDTLLSKQQLEKTRDDIASAILDYRVPGVSPGFFGVTLKTGWAHVNCRDAQTVEWVQGLIHRGLLLAGAPLRMMRGNDVPKDRFAVGFFPNSADDSNKDIITFLSRQNPLCTEHWRVIRRVNKGTLAQLNMSVDEASASFIEENKRLAFKLGMVHVRLINSKRRHQQQTSSLT